MANDNENLPERIKKEGELTRNTGKNSVKSLKEETANSSDKVTDRIKREGDLQRNSGTNSIKSLKNTININFEKFGDVFKKIDKNIAKQTGLTTSMVKQRQEAIEDKKQSDQYDGLAQDSREKQERAEGQDKIEKSGKGIDMHSILGFLGLGGLLAGGAAGAIKMLGAGGIAFMLRGPISEFVSGAVNEVLDRTTDAVKAWDFDKSSEIVKKVGGWLQSSLGGILTDGNKTEFADGVGTFFSWWMVGRMFGKRFAWILGGAMLARDWLPIEDGIVKDVVLTAGAVLSLFIPKIIKVVLKKALKGALAAASAGALATGLGLGLGGDKDKPDKDKIGPKQKKAPRFPSWNKARKLVPGTASIAKSLLSPTAWSLAGLEFVGSKTEQDAIDQYAAWRKQNPDADKMEYLKANPNRSRVYYDVAGITHKEEVANTKNPLVMDVSDDDLAMAKAAEAARLAPKVDPAELERQRLVEQNNKTLQPSFMATSTRDAAQELVDATTQYLKKQTQVIESGMRPVARTEQVLDKSEKASKAPSNVVVRGGDNHIQGGSSANSTTINNYHSSDKASQLDGKMLPFAQ